MGIRAHTTPDFSNTHLLCLQMAFNTFLQCLVFGVLIVAVSQVDGTEQTELAKCEAACVTKHTPNLANAANANLGNLANANLGNLANAASASATDTAAAIANCKKDCANGAAGVAITSFTFLLSLAIGLFAM